MADNLKSIDKATKIAVEGKTSNLPGGACELISSGSLSPCTIVVFGASGDLTARKLIPSLYNLFLNNVLPDHVNIVGCSRTDMTHEDLKERLKAALADSGNINLNRWEEFAKHLYYQQVVYDSPQSYSNLANFLHSLDKNNNTQGNRIFYLAVPPTISSKIVEMLGKSGLSNEETSGIGWARIVVEKPFGRDLKTAEKLDQTLHQSFKEDQIFRIDHYLAKETVQNILMLRFANTIFEPLWNKNYVDYVGIMTSETLGVEHRAGYYEQAGVLRDMFQNHMMQLLALTAMEPPSHFEAARVLDEKVKVFRSLKPFNMESQTENLILGQYGSGSIDGKPVPAYREEPGVDSASDIPTFAMMRLFVDNWRWKGVPFYLVSGKRLAKKLTKIVIQFKKVPHSMFRNVLEENIVANRLILGIYPEEKITLTFQTKNPGAKDCLRPVTMDFKYYKDYKGSTLEAYEKVLVDCILGDHMLFWRQDGIELSWSFLTPILEICETCSNRKDQLQSYDSGSWGPIAAQKWMNLILDD